MEVREITLEEYSAFIKRVPCNPMQTEGMYNRLQSPGIYGGYDGEELVIAAIGDYRPFKKVLKYFYIPYGPVSKDPLNLDMTTEFAAKLKEMHRMTRTIAIAMDPAIELYPMDGYGNRQEGFDNTGYRESMEKAGWTVLPLTYGVSRVCNPRQAAVIDLAELEGYEGIITTKTRLKRMYSEEEQLAKMKPRTQRYIRQANAAEYIKVEDGDLETLIYCGEMSGEAKHFEFFNKEALKQIIEGYGDRCAIRHCYLDTSLYKEQTLKELKETEENLSRLEQTKAVKKRKALEDKKEQLEKRLLEIESWNTDKLSLCCGLFLYADKETYFLASGIDRRYRKYQGASRLNWDEMNRSKARGVWKYNMLGIAGTYKKEDPNESLISFKRDLGCHVEEYQGMMFLKVHNFMYRKLIDMYWNKS